MLTDELLTYIFDGHPHLLAQPMAIWLASSRRFTAFVDTFRNKIRKKLRTTQDQETLFDLQLELETAYRLLQERRLSVIYEPQPGLVRCPDFAVTFTTSLTFMVEVTRLRPEQKEEMTEVQEQSSMANTALTSPLIDERLADTVVNKLGQLLTQQSNILVVGVETVQLTASDLRAMMIQVQQRVERNDFTFLQRHRFRDRADFFHHYQRLSEVLVSGPDLHTAESTIVWINPQAKHPLPGKVRTALYRTHGL